MDHENEQAIEALAKGLITLQAPEEIYYFEQLKQQSNEAIHDDDDAFAFGVAEVVPAITPIALTIAAAAVNFLLEKMSEAGTEILKDRYKTWVRGLFSTSPQIAPSLTEEQKEALTKALLAAALKSGVKTDLALKISSNFINNVL